MGCLIDLGSRTICIDLIVTTLYHFDVILDVDWLTEVRAEIDCETRLVTAYGPEGTPFTFPMQVSCPFRVLCYASLLKNV
ncbi:hypothetical protein PJP07_31125, partial [Mycobacterium kansasii]